MVNCLGRKQMLTNQRAIASVVLSNTISVHMQTNEGLILTMEDELDALPSQFDKSQFASLLFNEAPATGPGNDIPHPLNLTGETTRVLWTYPAPPFIY